MKIISQIITSTVLFFKRKKKIMKGDQLLSQSQNLDNISRVPLWLLSQFDPGWERSVLYSVWFFRDPDPPHLFSEATILQGVRLLLWIFCNRSGAEGRKKS